MVGETPNLAARFQALAEPDTVVISVDRPAAGRRFDYRDLGPQIKGISAPVPIWQVLCQGSTRGA